MYGKPQEILGSFCAPTHLLVKLHNFLVESYSYERDFQGLTYTLFENIAKNRYICMNFHVDPHGFLNCSSGEDLADAANAGVNGLYFHITLVITLQHFTAGSFMCTIRTELLQNIDLVTGLQKNVLSHMRHGSIEWTHTGHGSAPVPYRARSYSCCNLMDITDHVRRAGVVLTRRTPWWWSCPCQYGLCCHQAEKGASLSLLGWRHGLGRARTRRHHVTS